MVVKNLSKVFTAAMVVSAATAGSAALTGCKSSDVAIVAGTIAVVAATDSIYDNDWERRHHHDHWNRDRWDRPSRPVRPSVPRRNPGDVRHTPAPATPRPGRFAGTLAAPVLAAEAAVQGLANKYNLPLEAAEKLSGLLNSQNGIAAVGFSDDDVTAMARFELPSTGAIDRLATSLALSRTATEELVGNLMLETKEQMADVSSPAWEACMATGKWTTDANGGTCKSTDWTGCSPATGASICASVK